MISLYHFTQKSVKKLKPLSTPLNAQNSLRMDKPMGLWVSDEDAEMPWSRWCIGEAFGLERLALKWKINLKQDSNILLIDNPYSLLEFGEEYRGEPSYHGLNINWQRVATLYNGILITPYQHSLRFNEHCRWYYGWDCASGCIWNADVIESVELER